MIAGAGVGWIAQIICSDDLASGQLVSSDLGGWFPPGDEHHVLFPSNRSLSPKVRAFVDFSISVRSGEERATKPLSRKARPGAELAKLEPAEDTPGNQPGGNVTGYTDMSSEIVPKEFGLLHELLPRATRFGAVLWRKRHKLPRSISLTYT